MFDLEKICLICLLWLVSQQRTAESFHCVCLSLCPSACLWQEVVKNEIQVMNNLDQANLIQLYAAYESRNDIILVLE